MANNNKWVEDRLSALDPPSGWKPDSAAALPKVQERERAYRRHRAQWAWSSMAAGLFFMAILLTPAKCALGVCRTPEVAAGAPAPEVEPVPAVEPNFKESGSPTAPITCEIFSDYQCPHCATVFEQVVPMLLAEYVQTGKVKFVHRDLPLPQHQHARLAARYANAAGHIGKYELVVNQIFRTQAVWAQSGNVDAQVSQVLPPAEMLRVRALVQNDGHLDDGVASDIEIARSDSLNQTPSLVVTYKGKRQVLAPVPPYSLLKSYLDELLTK